MANGVERAKPQRGRKYRISDVVEVVDDVSSGTGNVKIRHSGGETAWRNPSRFKWQDLGPALAEGYYKDNKGHFWYLRGGFHWIAKTTDNTTYLPVGIQPEFPIRRVSVEDELIYE